VKTFILKRNRNKRNPHSFPTRRSSDLRNRLPIRELPGGLVDEDRFHFPSFAGFIQSCLELVHITSFRFPHRQQLRFVGTTAASRSEEHTSELQSLYYLLCRLLLEKNNT